MKSLLTISALAIAAMVSSCNNAQQANDNQANADSASINVETQIEAVTTPAEAIAKLKEGNARFVSQESVHPHNKKNRLDATVNGQNPFASVVACSDSREPVELIFDQGIGDIFVIRTAGNSVNDDIVMGSVDYAIDHLGVKAVVVLGHTHCGGVTSAITVAEEGEHAHEAHGKINELVGTIRADVQEYVGDLSKLNEAVIANINAQVARIKEVEYIKALIEEGKVIVVGACYDIATGEVTYLD